MYLTVVHQIVERILTKYGYDENREDGGDGHVGGVVDNRGGAPVGCLDGAVAGSAPALSQI